jgi:hypothetical protein
MTPSEMRGRAALLLEDLRQIVEGEATRDILSTAEQLLWAADELEEIAASRAAEADQLL